MGRKNQNMRGQENSTSCLVFRTNSGELLPRSHPSHPGSRGGNGKPWGYVSSQGHLGACGRYISKAVRDILALSCQNPAAFRSNNTSLCPYEPCPCFLIISCWRMGLRRRAQLCPSVSRYLCFPQRRRLARFLQDFCNAPLFVAFQKRNFSFFPPLWMIWFCPFLLSHPSSAHSSTALSAVSSSAKPCKSYFFPKWNFTDSGKLLQNVSVYEPTFAAQKVVAVKFPPSYRYGSPLDFVLKL